VEQTYQHIKRVNRGSACLRQLVIEDSRNKSPLPPCCFHIRKQIGSAFTLAESCCWSKASALLSMLAFILSEFDNSQQSSPQNSCWGFPQQTTAVSGGWFPIPETSPTPRPLPATPHRGLSSSCRQLQEALVRNHRPGSRRKPRALLARHLAGLARHCPLST